MPPISRIEKLLKERMPLGTTLADAAALRRFPVAIVCGDWGDPQAQAIVFSLVNMALRTFKERIYLVGLENQPGRLNWGATSESSFYDAILRLASEVDGLDRLRRERPPSGTPCLAVGENAGYPEPPAMVIHAGGWGVALNTPLPAVFTGPNPVSAILAACFGTAKLIAKALGVDVLGERLILSTYDFTQGAPAAPLPTWPSNKLLPPISLLGGGAIGTGFVYAALLAPNKGERLSVIDDDFYQVENLETSLLVTKPMVERDAMKAEALAELARPRFDLVWAIDRRIEDGDVLLDSDLGFAVLGPDNVDARLLFADANVRALLNGGVGGDAPGSEGMVMISRHGPERRTLERLYRRTPRAGVVSMLNPTEEEVLAAVADGHSRDRLGEFAGDPCSMLSYLGTSIGASFLGGAVGALLFGEVVKEALVPGYRAPSYVCFDLFGLVGRPRIRV